MSKSKSKSKSPSKGGKRKGPVTTAEGNALVAFRCHQGIVSAFVAKYGGTAAAWSALRKHMTSVAAAAVRG